jgi:hypothetical protein
MTKHTDKLVADLEQSSKFYAFFLATDKTTEMSDAAQLVVLVPRVDAEFNVTLTVNISSQFR